MLKTLLDKLEKIRKELQSDKVFDCIGRIFQEVSIKQYMELAVTEDPDRVAKELDGRLTKEQILALAKREVSLFGSGGDVAKELPRLRADIDQEIHFRLLPGYVRQYIEQAAPLVDIEIEGDTGGIFSFRPRRLSVLDPILPAMELYPEKMRDRLSVSRPSDQIDAIWLRPGEPVFERFRTLVSDRLGIVGRRGAVFVDPTSERPYLFHMALLSIIRKADTELAELGQEETLDCCLVGVKQFEGAELALCPVEHLLLLKGGHGLPPSGQRLAVVAEQMKEQTLAFLIERVGRKKALERKKQLLGSMLDRESFLHRAFDFQEAELAVARAKHSEKARSGNRKAIETLEEVKRQQKQLANRRANAVAVIKREPDLITIGPVTFVAHALVVPSADPKEIEEHDQDVELAAIKVAWAFEEAAGAKVVDVHTPQLARKAGLPENPGFDLLSIRRGNEKRAIEVKGRAEMGDVEVSANEWAKACNMRDGYWLYAVYNCATPSPRLVRVQDPFGSLLAKAKGSVLISVKEIAQAATGSIA